MVGDALPETGAKLFKAESAFDLAQGQVGYEGSLVVVALCKFGLKSRLQPLDRVGRRLQMHIGECLTHLKGTGVIGHQVHMKGTDVLGGPLDARTDFIFQRPVCPPRFSSGGLGKEGPDEVDVRRPALEVSVVVAAHGFNGKGDGTGRQEHQGALVGEEAGEGRGEVDLGHVEVLLTWELFRDGSSSYLD